VSANLDLVRSMYAASERGEDFPTGWAHPGVEFVIADGPEPSSGTGLSHANDVWRDFVSPWDQFRPEVEDFRELDNERILVLGRAVGKGKQSGLDLQLMRTEFADVVHVRDGKVIKVVVYFDRDRAFADLGLTPEDTTSEPD
jgi:ketosteroid isomerase-like protein